MSRVKFPCERLNCRDPFCDRDHVGIDCCDHGVPFEDECKECDEAVLEAQ